MSDTAEAEQTKTRSIYIRNKPNVLQILHAIFKTAVQ